MPAATCVAVAVLYVVIGAQPVHAQVLPQTPVSDTGFGELVTNPAKWLTNMFNAALANLGRKTTGDVVDFMG